jgi:hypothetical protein
VRESRSSAAMQEIRCALSKNVSRKGPRNCRSLGFARDDKGEGDFPMESGCGSRRFFITLGGPQAHDTFGQKLLSIERPPSPLSSRR